MNIIEAMQAAKNGENITTKQVVYDTEICLRHMGAGTFFVYHLVDGFWVYKYETRSFSMDEILDLVWEILPEAEFKTPPNLARRTNEISVS